MASLLDKVQNGQLQRDSTGSLSVESPEELQTLSGKMGLQAPPLTAIGAGVLTSNPNQLKMMGTKAQKNAAISAANQPGQSLQDTLRQGQGNERSQATGQEQSEMQKSRDLQNLGGLGDRVANFIDAQRAKLVAAQPVAVQAQDQFNGKDVSQIKPLLDQLRQNPTDQNLQLQVNQALGYDTKTQLSPAQINDLYQNATDAISTGAAGNVANDLTVADLTQDPKFGYDSAELAHLLGLPEDQVQHMTVANIRDQIQRVQADEFSNTSKLQQQGQSAQLGGAERAFASVGAREASRTGLRSSEADMNHLQQQIAGADQVSFGGKQYSVEDLLKDDNISGIVADYLNSAQGSTERTQLEQTEPQLVQFIQKNQNVLSDAADKLSQGAQTFQDTQSYNQKLAAQLPANLQKLVTPEAGSLSASKIDVSQHPLLQYLQTDPNAAQYLQGVGDVDAQALTALNTDQLGQLFGNKGQKWNEYQQGRKTVDTQMQLADQAGNDPTKVANLIFNGTNGQRDLGAIQQDYDTSKRASALGLGGDPSVYGQLDSDGDGKVDSPAQLLDAYKQRVGSYTINDALSGKSAGSGALNVPAGPGMSDQQKSLYDKLSSYADDGKIDSGELSKSSITSDDINGLNWNAPAFQGTNLASAVAQKEVGEIEGKYNTSDPAQAAQALQELTQRRDALGQVATSKGGQASDIVSGLSGEMSKLSAAVDKGKASAQTAATQAAQSATNAKQQQWDKLYGDVKQDRFGRYYRVVNGQMSMTAPPPARP